LADPDPAVRRTAVAALTEHTPDGYASALFDALADDDAAVRRTAADGARELVEVVTNPAAAGAQLDSPDPVVRACVVYLLSSRRVGDPAHYRAALADPDHRVRIEAVRALVSVDDASTVATAAGDGNREVRIAVANACATLRAGADTVRDLIGDPDPLVRAAALAALGEIGCGDEDIAVVAPALTESAWQVRVGAARALAGASAAEAVPRLTFALEDPHLDVRKAAVLGLARWTASDGAARDALGIAVKDSDADVRAYARRALLEAGVHSGG
ncbi:HEAT repeat domain-containing protein, partial [Mycolicibacter senuensis]|uniref:HEAT repeat domain-containing protein n=1 Tax=Mycolicibacter senuensis TaxID=386913 RepID=UPI000DCDE7AE